MSKKEQRFINKCMNFDQLLFRMEELDHQKKHLEEQVNMIDEAIKEMDGEQAKIVENLKSRNCMLNLEYISLYDGGEEELVYIMVYKNAIIMYCKGESAVAKCHPEDEYNPMVGYALCRNRLIEKLLKKKYNL